MIKTILAPNSSSLKKKLHLQDDESNSKTLKWKLQSFPAHKVLSKSVMKYLAKNVQSLMISNIQALF